MRKRYFSILAAAVCLTATSQVKIDMAGAKLIEQLHQINTGVEVVNPDLRLVGNLAVDGGDSRATATTVKTDNEIGAYVYVDKSSSIDDLTLGGAVTVVRQASDDLYSVSLPADRLEDFINQSGVNYVSIGFEQKMSMNNARPSGGVTAVHAGEGLDRAYTGAGVIVSMFDTGMDPNHINFRNPDDDYATTRVKGVLSYTGSNGVPTARATTPEAIASFTTDLPSATHGTHVMGIAAGSYNGPGAHNDGRSLSEVDNMSLYGVAKGSDIFMAGGRLYNNNITNGVSEIVKYAEEQGKPVVINLSLGSVSGPHDGTDAMSTDLAELGKRAIICVASGNDGDRKCAVTIQGGGLSASSLRNTVGITTFTAGQDTHLIHLWNSVSDPFAKFEFILLNTATREVVYSREIGNLNGQYVRIGASGASSSYEKPEAFDEAFTASSYINIRTFVNYTNQKYVAEIDHKLTAGTNSILVPCFRITRDRGTIVTGQNSDGEFTNWNLTGTYTDGGVQYAALTDGSANGSVSAMATGDNILVVGSYNSQRTFGYLDGRSGYYYPGVGDVNDMSNFSSYGTNVSTGAGVPHVSAPGSVIVSSMNSYYTAEGSLYGISSASASKDNNQYYWGPMQGTSMATPFVTGVVALWLEANPNLTIDDIKDIATTTAVKNSYYPTSSSSSDKEKQLKWGAGAISAIDGLKEVLARNVSIGGVFEDVEKQLVVSQSQGSVEVFVAGAESVDAKLFAVTGAQVASARATGNEATLSTEGLAKGVYVLNVNGLYSKKIVVR